VRGAWNSAVSTDRQNSRYDTPGWVGSALCSTSVLGRRGAPYRTFVLLSPKRHLKCTWAGNPKPKRPRKRLGDWHAMSCGPCCLRRAASMPLFLKLTTAATTGRPSMPRIQTPERHRDERKSSGPRGLSAYLYTGCWQPITLSPHPSDLFGLTPTHSTDRRNCSRAKPIRQARNRY
jgi:hypothetical protein